MHKRGKHLFPIPALFHHLFPRAALFLFQRLIKIYHENNHFNSHFGLSLYLCSKQSLKRRRGIASLVTSIAVIPSQNIKLLSLFSNNSTLSQQRPTYGIILLMNLSMLANNLRFESKIPPCKKDKTKQKNPSNYS